MQKFAEEEHADKKHQHHDERPPNLSCRSSSFDLVAHGVRLRSSSGHGDRSTAARQIPFLSCGLLARLRQPAECCVRDIIYGHLTLNFERDYEYVPAAIVGGKQVSWQCGPGRRSAARAAAFGTIAKCGSVFALAFAILVAAAPLATAAAPAKPDEKAAANDVAAKEEKLFDYRQTTLDNGLQVLTLEDFILPDRECTGFGTNVGSKDENPERQGFAHMFEHMMFRGNGTAWPDGPFRT